MQEHTAHDRPYVRLLIMTLLSFVAMYALMYAMVDTPANVLPNLNQAYMAGLMTAPMVVIEVLLMRAMYRERRRNVIVMAAAVLAGVAFFTMIRKQTAIGDDQFLRSMIPHHGGAILMCGEAPIRSNEVRELCRNIIAGQQQEIAQMKAMLAR